jgi:hypothetical protein
MLGAPITKGQLKRGGRLSELVLPGCSSVKQELNAKQAILELYK